MNFKNITPNQTIAMDSLVAGWQFGIDRRTSKALIRRGLAVKQRWQGMWIPKILPAAAEAWSARRRKEVQG